MGVGPQSLPTFFSMVAYLGVNMSLWFGLKSPYNQIGFMGKKNKTKQKEKKTSRFYENWNCDECVA